MVGNWERDIDGGFEREREREFCFENWNTVRGREGFSCGFIIWFATCDREKAWEKGETLVLSELMKVSFKISLNMRQYLRLTCDIL